MNNTRTPVLCQVQLMVEYSIGLFEIAKLFDFLPQ